MLNKLFEWLARIWAVNDPLPRDCDLLVPVAHGATEHWLTNGAYAVTKETVTCLMKLRNLGKVPYVFFGAFTGSKYPVIEERVKQNCINGIYVGTVLSTIEECMKIKEALPKSYIPQNIVVITDEAHSRRCRIVWRTFFPLSEVHIISVKISETVDDESPMLPYKLGIWAILAFQALPTPYFWYLSKRGPEYMAKKATVLHQPIAQ